jgi:hypothetical protein
MKTSKHKKINRNQPLNVLAFHLLMDIKTGDNSSEDMVALEAVVDEEETSEILPANLLIWPNSMLKIPILQRNKNRKKKRKKDKDITEEEVNGVKKEQFSPKFPKKPLKAILVNI